MGNNQSNHFPHIPGKITWYWTRLTTVNHRPFLRLFFLRGGAFCTQANEHVVILTLTLLVLIFIVYQISELLHSKAKLKYGQWRSGVFFEMSKRPGYCGRTRSSCSFDGVLPFIAPNSSTLSSRSSKAILRITGK